MFCLCIIFLQFYFCSFSLHDERIFRLSSHITDFISYSICLFIIVSKLYFIFYFSLPFFLLASSFIFRSIYFCSCFRKTSTSPVSLPIFKSFPKFSSSSYDNSFSYFAFFLVFGVVTTSFNVQVLLLLVDIIFLFVGFKIGPD